MGRRALVIAAWTGVVVVAVVLRVLGLRFGLPYAFHPDEWRVLVVADQVRAHPGGAIAFWNYPPALANLVALSVPHAAGVLGGRVLVLVMGVLAVIAVGAAAHRSAGALAGIAAASIAAVSPLMVEQSRYVTVDMPTALGAALVALGAAIIVRRRSWWAYALAGAAVGFCAAFKYVGALSAVVVVAAFALTERRRALARLPLLVIAGAAAVAAFVALDYQVLWSVPRLRVALADEFHHYAAKRGGGYDSPHAWRYVLAYTFLYGLTPLASLALAGVALRTARRAGATLAILAGGAAWWLFVATRLVFFARNLAHVLPLLFVVAGVGFAALASRVANTRLRAAALAVVLALPAFQSARFAVDLVRPDTRLEAAAWIRDHVPAQDVLLVVPDAYDHYLPPQQIHRRRVRHVPGYVSPAALARMGQYVIVSWGSVSRYLRTPAEQPGAVREFEDWYASLRQNATLAARFERPAAPGGELFGSTADIYHNPRIELWQLHK